MNILAITQARYGSSRLPGKVLKTVDNGKTLLEIHIERILKSKQITKLYIATTEEPEAKGIVELADKMKVGSYCGSLTNVLDRFYQIVVKEKPDYVVRLTSDCPLIDAEIIDQVILAAVEGNYDYVSNTLKPTYPDGLDVEVFKFTAIEKAWKDAQLDSDKEHVTPYIWRNSSFHQANLFSSFAVENAVDYSAVRLTVDEMNDFLLVKQLLNALGDNKGWKEYVDYLTSHPELARLNNTITRNEGYLNSLKKDGN